ncbi:MAG: ATP-grasp domain-containing protein [Thermodesulfobacteriota bacterium]
MGILSLRNHRYHPNRRLMEAAVEKGHRAVLFPPARVYLSASGEGLKIVRQGKPLSPDVVLPRIGSTIRDFPLSLVRQMELMGIRVVNGSAAVEISRNKFRTLQALAARRVPLPRSHFVSNERNLAAAARDIGGPPFVVKTVHGRQGREVFLVNDAGEALRLLRDRSRNPGEGMVLQEFIPPEARRRDIRVLVLGSAVASSMALQPRRGEFRANVHQRGRCEPLRLTKAMERAALAASEAVGLDISGIDMIECLDGSLQVVDVNYSPGFRGLERCTGTDIASRIISFATAPKGFAG